jgi:hypothetical protein
MSRSFCLALLLLTSSAPALAQADGSSPLGTDSPALAAARTTPSTQAIEDARAVLLALRVDQMIGGMAESAGTQASAELLAEVRQAPDGEATLAAWDRDYPGGRLAFAERYSDILIDKFRSGRLLFVDHLAIYMASLANADDLHLSRVTLLDENGAMKTGEALAAARIALVNSGAAQRLAAFQAQVTAEMSRFGQELGESFGIQAYQQTVQEAQSRRPPASP